MVTLNEITGTGQPLSRSARTKMTPSSSRTLGGRPAPDAAVGQGLPAGAPLAQVRVLRPVRPHPVAWTDVAGARNVLISAAGWVIEDHRALRAHMTGNGQLSGRADCTHRSPCSARGWPSPNRPRPARITAARRAFSLTVPSRSVMPSVDVARGRPLA